MQIEKVFEWGCITSIGEIFIDPYNFQYIYNKVTISNKRKKEISNLIFSFFFPRKITYYLRYIHTIYQKPT